MFHLWDFKFIIIPHLHSFLIFIEDVDIQANIQLINSGLTVWSLVACFNSFVPKCSILLILTCICHAAWKRNTLPKLFRMNLEEMDWNYCKIQRKASYVFRPVVSVSLSCLRLLRSVVCFLLISSIFSLFTTLLLLRYLNRRANFNFKVSCKYM